MIPRDPKTGYHWIWITPLACIGLFVHGMIARGEHVLGHMRNRYMEWKHPEIKRLRVLSGIDVKNRSKDDQVPPCHGIR